MNKTAIKNFAVWARRKLISDITYKAGMLGITENGIAEPLPISTRDLQFFDIGTKDYAEVSGNEINQRKALIDAVKTKEKSSKSYKEAFDYIVEEVAYTWFNRLIAVRFMEVNDYLPSGVRVLSSLNSAKNEPDFVTTPFDTDLNFTADEQDKVIRLKDENKLDELFRMLFIKQCNKLHEILPELFEKTDDYTELLLTISFTDKDGVVYHLTHDISEDDFNVEKEGQVEIIGWLYQYYNTEPKDTVFANLKKNIKISKENIPAATQLFTPDWIVRYMVENSLGRLWIDGHPNDNLKSEWKYYLDEVEQEAEVQKQLDEIRAEYKSIKPEEIKIIDPCMGSGHILVYAFDVLMQIYESYGYTQRDAARSILINNIHGVDIDKRAYQMAYFAVMMKGRQYDRRFFSRNVIPNLTYSTPVYNSDKANLLGDYFASYLGNCAFADEAGLGSLRNETYYTAEHIDNILTSCDAFQYDIFDRDDIILMCRTAANGLKLIDILSQKYDVVITNPPYMSASGMSPILSKYIKEYYPDSKSDLFAVFIERCLQMTKQNRYTAMITQHSWMFLSSFEKLRSKLQLKTTVNMAHLGARAFDEIGGEVVQTTAFVKLNSYIKDYSGSYVRLVDVIGENEKKNTFLSGENRYIAKQDNFSKIPGSPVAYWVSENALNAYNNKHISNYMNCKSGIMTGSDNYIRLWYELGIKTIKFNCSTASDMGNFKWFPLNSGGEFRKWYGNNIKVVNLWNNGAEIKSKVKNYRLRDDRYYFKRGITWGRITSSQIAFREVIEGSLFGDAGPIGFIEDKRFYVLGFLNSKVVKNLLQITNPTLNFQVHDIMELPLVFTEDNYYAVENLVEYNIKISQSDWDFFETSWDFKEHPLVRLSKSLWDGTAIGATMKYYYGCHPEVSCPLELCYMLWQGECNERFNTLKANEEELNRIFIDIYGLQDELTPEVEDKDVTVRKANLQREIKSLISYAVGCMFGRYSLDVEGLAYAGGEWDDSKYITYKADEDNIIPITDDEYFKDDIVGRFVEFISTVYGEETLEENLTFIANALGNKGKTSREVIRNYFLNDFIKDHIKIYQKRPIYWLFDSGKQNGFKALCYMHRWNADTTGNMRVEYLHRTQKVYEKELERMQEIIDNSSDNKEISAATKRKEKLQKQLKETKEYDAKVAHLALSRIDIDLDDGVKVNYEKVQTASDGTMLQILAKI